MTIAASGTEVEIKYDRKTYTVTFNANGGSTVTSQSVRYGATATKPADPTKTATTTTEYTFADWYSDSGLTTSFSFDTAIKEDITLYAKWTEKAVTLEQVFRTGKDEVIAGDIAVSSDGGTTLKFVPAENWNSSAYTEYTVIGVCVNTSYMINLANEEMSWTDADAKYPDEDGWYLPTREQLKAVYNIKETLNASLGEISDAAKLIDKYYWSSEPYNDNAFVFYFLDGFENTIYPKYRTQYVRVVRDLEVTPTTYIGTKAPSEAKSVGDIVFTDGSATPYSEDLTLTDDEKNAAIAVIFYVGTDCSNDSTSRTLGVGLAQNQSGLAWCLDSANACYVNITTIQESDKDGSDNLSQIGEFLDENDELNDDTGTADKYPAFYFAKNYASQTGSNVSGTDYEDGWYLPAKAELQKIYESLSTVNKELAACGGTEFNQYH